MTTPSLPIPLLLSPSPAQIEKVCACACVLKDRSVHVHVHKSCGSHKTNITSVPPIFDCHMYEVVCMSKRYTGLSIISVERGVASVKRGVA